MSDPLVTTTETPLDLDGEWARFDAVDYLHCFADDAHGCAISASKTIHEIAERHAALIAEVRALRARVENHHCGGRAAAGE